MMINEAKLPARRDVAIAEWYKEAVSTPRPGSNRTNAGTKTSSAANSKQPSHNSIKVTDNNRNKNNCYFIHYY